MSATTETLTQAARLISIEASANAGRIHPALLALDDAAGPLRAVGTDLKGVVQSSDHPDPTFASVGKIDEAAKDRRRVSSILTTQLNLSKELAGILANWAPDETKQAHLRGLNMSNESVWCPNHATHGMRETRGLDRQYCDWCTDFKQRHKILPTRWLCDVASRRKINSADIAKALRDAASEAREKRAEAKAQKSAG